MCAFVVFLVVHVTMVVAHRVRPEHEPHRHGHGRRPAARPVPRAWSGSASSLLAERPGQLGGVATPAGRPARRQGDRHAGHAAPARPRRARWPSSAARTSRPSSGPTARCPPARSGRRWPPTASRITGSRCTAWSRTRSSCRWTTSGRWPRRRRSRCTTASRAGRASPQWGGLPMAELIEAGPAQARGAGRRLLLLRRGPRRRPVLRQPHDRERSCTRRRCWPTR